MKCLRFGVFAGLLASGASAAEFEAAQSVWPAGRETERNLFVGFRTTVDGSAATLRYSASSIARVWLNGEFLAYGPARGPHGLDRIDEIPLAGLVTNGVNTLAFEVAGYNVESFYLLNEPAYLAAEVTDGAGRILASTAPQGAFESFVLTERVQKTPRFSYQRPFCEIYALTPASTAWRTGASRTPCAELAAVAGSPWTDRVFPYPDYTVSTVFRPVKGGRLERRVPAKFHPGRSVTGESRSSRGYAEAEIAIQPVREIQSLPSVDAHPVEPTAAYAVDEKSYILFDHGLNDTGFLGARVVCRKPGRVYFYFDEVLKDGDIDVARMGWQCVNALTYDFTEPGEYEIEAFEPNTFRYLKVMSDTFEGDVANLFMRAYKNGEAKTATFRSTDPTLDRIFEAAKETFVQNAVDAFTDCPSRERAGWLCDSFFSGRTAALLTGNTSVERGFLENYAKCPKTLAGGFLPMCYPADAGLLPNWNFWLVLELEEYLARSGDRALVDEMKPKVLGIVEAFRRFRNSDGLLENLPGWVFIEWSRANDLVKDVNYPTNMTYAEMLETVTRLYALPEYAAEAAKVRETVRRQSWTGEWFCDNAVRQSDGSLKLSGECTETCQYYAFFFKTATPETHPQLWERLVRDFGPERRTTKRHPQIPFANAFIGNYLRLELLSRAGRAQQILDETKGYFLGMAEKTGTLWEHDNVSNSCDHGFASHVALMLVRDVLGMTVDPRTGEIRYRPTDAELKGGVVTLPTAKGPLELAWRRGGRVEYGKPLVVDFGAQGEGGYPAAVIASVDGRDVKLRLSYSTHPEGLGERGDFWHATRATYLGPDVLLPILPASTDRFDVFTVSGPGTVRAAKCQGLVRYLRIAVDAPGAAVDVDKVVLENRAVHAVDPVVGSFDCSDPELAKIWQASVRTCQLSAVPSYTATHVMPAVTTLPYLSDGAKRDRLVWSGDLWWAQRNMYAAFGPNSPYMIGSLDMLAENQTPAGYINACPYPESRGPITTEVYGPFGSDEFAAWFVPVLADHYLYTGDREVLARRYPNAVKVLDYLAAHQAADGLFEQRAETAKHSEGLAVGGTSLHHRTYMHLLLWRSYVDAAELAMALGKKDDATRFTAAATRLEALLRTRFFRPDLGRFGLSLEQPDAPAFVANAAALAFGFLKGDEAMGVLKQLVRDKHGKFQLMAIRGAFELKDGVKAVELLNAHNWRSVVSDDWAGTHLTSECMSLKKSGWGDPAHPDTALAGVLTDYVLGVRPTSPGYATYVVDPIPVPGVTWAKGTVPTPRGVLQVEWRRDGENLSVKSCFGGGSSRGRWRRHSRRDWR